MAIRDIIQTLKNKEGTLTNNRVCNFAYDDTAYTEDLASGVLNYNYNNHNNIPVKDNTVIKVNPTVTSKGFRSQVSTLPRMLLNHIFGRVSYNLNKTVDVLNEALQAFYNAIGQANGLATLDNDGRLPYSQLPLSAVEYKGAWNAETNTPALASGIGTFGDEYIVSVQGTRNLGEGNVTYRVGDRVIYNGSIWQRIPSSSVRTVNSKAPDTNGNVTINAEDIVTPDVYSYDRRNLGKVWTQSPTYSQSYMEFVTSHNNIWLAGGEGILKSTDGETWTKVSYINSNQTVKKILWGNGLWLACINNGGGIRWSENGDTWTECSFISGAFHVSNVTVDDIAYGNGKYVAPVTVTNASGIYTSTDGKVWTRVSNDHGLSYIFFGNGIFIGYNDVNGAYWSVDGVTWTACTGDNTVFRDIYCSNDLFVACSTQGMWWSSDGKHWSQATGDSTSYTFFIAYYVEGLYVAGGDHGIWWSNDGMNWIQGSTASVSYYSGIFYAYDLWVIATGNSVYWSKDGKNWVMATGSNYYSAHAVFASNKTWVLACYGHGMYYSKIELSNNVSAILDWLIYAVDNMLA